MDILQNLVLRVRSLLGARSLEGELRDELSFHIAMQTEANMRAGMAPAEARRRALQAFGGVDRMSEECREARAGSRLHLLLRAVRLGARRLRREPAVVLPSVSTIAIGFGALTAIFALTDAVLLRPLPYPDADRIVVLRHGQAGWGIPETGQSAGTFAHYLEGARTFESIGAWFPRELSITEREAPERILAALVTPGVLRSLGVQPVLGRAFNDEDSGGGAVILSHAFWQQRYGGDAGVIGRHIEINAVAREIVGVLPPRTDFPNAATQMLFGMGTGSDAEEGDLRDMFMEAIGRLLPGVSVTDAEADLARLVATLPERYGDVTLSQLAESRLEPRVRQLKESIVGDVRPALLLLLCTAAFVLLIALANVANLVLVRAEHQRREIALERALGAGSGAVALRFVAEYALLSGAGAALGVLLAWAAIYWRFGFEAWQIPRLQDVALSGRSLLVVAGAAVLTAAVLTAVGIARAGGADVGDTLKGSVQRITSSRQSQRAQNALTAVQVALACALLIGAAVMAQSVVRLGRVPLGFVAQHAVAFDIALPVRQYRGYTAQAQFHDRLTERLRSFSGVESVGAVTTLPLTPQPNWFDTRIAAGAMARDDVMPLATMRAATPGYFAAMGIPVLRGRTFDARDLTDAAAGVILSASVAHLLFGTVDVIGRAVELQKETGTLTVVGVVGDVRNASLAAPAAPIVYLPSVGDAALNAAAPIPIWPSELTFVVRSSLPLHTLLPSLRAALAELDPSLPLAYPRTLDALVAASSARTRMTAWLLLAAASGALLLGIVGIYGVISYTVSRRSPELALRMVLGASPAAVSRGVLRQAAMIAATGALAGLPVALGLTRLLSSMLYEVSPHDVRALALVPVGMLVVALLASSVPAARAARTPPARVLAGD
jgi:putative ABC transport system permease protein